MRRRQAWRVGVGLTMALLAAAGCTGTPADSPPRGGTLTGRTWVVTSLPGQVSPPAGTHADIRFDGANASGTTGCNHFGASYSTSSAGSIHFGELTSTLIGCPDPEAAFETAYLTALGQAAGYRSDGRRLTLFNAAGGAARRVFGGGVLVTLREAGSWGIIARSVGREQR